MSRCLRPQWVVPLAALMIGPIVQSIEPAERVKFDRAPLPEFIFRTDANNRSPLPEGEVQQTSDRNQSQTGKSSVRIPGPFTSRDDRNEYSKVVLKNGLTAIVFERRDSPLVALTVYLRAGCLDEPETARGVAQLTERMVFENSGGKFAKETRSLGGMIAGGSFRDYSYGQVLVPAEHFAQALGLQAEALGNRSFGRTDLATPGSGAFLCSRSETDVHRVAGFARFYELALGAAQIPTTQKEAVDLEDILSFYGRYYRPNNIILVACGNLERRQVLDEIVKAYSDFTPGELEQRVQEAERPIGLRYSLEGNNLHESWLYIGFQVPAAYTDDWYACQLIRALLAEGETSIFSRQLKEDKEWVNSVSTHQMDLKGPAYLTFRFSINVRHLDSIESSVWIELEKLKRGEVEDSDIVRAQRLLELQVYLDQEDLGKFGLQLARTEDLAGYQNMRERIERIRAVSREQIVHAARANLVLSTCSILEDLPSDAKVAAKTSETLSSALETASSSYRTENQLGGSNLEVAQQKRPDKVNVGVASPTSKEVSDAWVNIPLTAYRILRGPQVLVKESRAFPIVSIGIFFPGGRIFEGTSNSGITDLMIRTSVRGAARPSSAELFSGFEGNGTRLFKFVQPDFFGFVLSGLKEGVGKSLDHLIAVIKEPRFDPLDVEREKRIAIFDLDRLSDDQESYSRFVFKKTLYGAHPYGFLPLGNKESVEAISRDDLVEWHEEFVVHSIPVIVISGDTQGSELVARLSGSFGTSRVQPLAWDMALPAKRSEHPREKLEVLARDSSYVFAGFVTAGTTQPEDRALWFISTLLSGVGGRLLDTVGRKGTPVLDMQAEYKPAKVGGEFYAFAHTIGDYNLAMASMKEQFKRLSYESLSDSELSAAKLYAKGLWLARLQIRTQQSLEFSRMALEGLTLDEIREYSNQFDFVTAIDIQNLSRKYFDLQNLVVGGTLQSEP